MCIDVKSGNLRCAYNLVRGRDEKTYVLVEIFFICLCSSRIRKLHSRSIIYLMNDVIPPVSINFSPKPTFRPCAQSHQPFCSSLDSDRKDIDPQNWGGGG